MPQIEPHLKKKIRWVILGFVIFTLFFTAFGDRGLLKIFRLRKELKRLETSLKNLESQNTDISKNIEKMKKERVFQERSVRETLGLVRDDDIVYEFQDELGALAQKSNTAVNKIAAEKKK
ncbi:MAG: septum formation initiator family protein [Deltaproteobacteria bacterium]